MDIHNYKKRLEDSIKRIKNSKDISPKNKQLIFDFVDDMVGRENIERVLGLNFKYGKENISIHHKEHPLRAFVIDKKFLRIKEVKEPTGKENELDKRLFIFYTIKDKNWIDWMTKIFWKHFNNTLDAKKRLEELEKINNQFNI